MKLRMVLASLVVTLAAHGAGAVVLRYQYEQGDQLKYRDQMALAFMADPQGEAGDAARFQFRSNSLLQQTVKKVDGDTYTVEYETKENQSEVISGDGETEKSEHTGHPERIKLTSRGRVLERKSLGDDDNEPMGYTTKLDEFAIIQQVFDGLTFPEGDVNPGDTWGEPLKIDLTPDDKDLRTIVEIEAKTLFKRLVKVRGELCAELVTDFTIPLKTPKDKESKELQLTIEGEVMGHLTSFFAVEQGHAIVELATLGAVGQMTLRPPGMGKQTVGGKMKIHVKTVLVE